MISEKKSEGRKVENDIIQVKVEDNKLKIEVGIDQLLLATALGNPGYEVIDRKAFLNI